MFFEKIPVGLIRRRFISMVISRQLLLPLFICLLLPLIAKPQLIKEEFTVQAYHDPFDEDMDNWRNMSTSDNLFLIQEGEYLLRRKNPASGYSIFPKWKNKLSAFSLQASIKLEDAKNGESAVGLIFMAQEDASGAFIFEFNQKGQYRLKQLVGLSYKLLTGDVKSNGWVDSDVLNSPGQYNRVEIRTSKRNYDVYVNEKYLLSFTEIAYKTGDIGISIGPATKARVDFIAVNESASAEGKTEAPPTLSGLEGTPGKDPKPGGKSDVASGSPDALKKLVDQISDLKMENQVLRDSLNLVKKQLKTANARSNSQEPK